MSAETEGGFIAMMAVNGSIEGRRLAGIVAPFVKHVRDLADHDPTRADPGVMRGVRMYEIAFIEAWWEATK